VIIADTSGLLAWFNRTEPEHAAVRRVVERHAGPLAVSPYVIAELDYLVSTRVGVAAEVAMLKELAGGAYMLPGIEAADLSRLTDLIERYKDQGIGVTDASIVLLADRLGSRDVLTLDRRHFEVLRPLSGGRFRLLPSPVST
jgi:predicted nucleic acid-binding protein